MKRATLERVQARLGEYVASSVKDPVLILREGEPVAMLIGLGRKERGKPVKLQHVLKRAWKDYEECGGIPHAQFWTAVSKEVQSRQNRPGTKPGKK